MDLIQNPILQNLTKKLHPCDLAAEVIPGFKSWPYIQLWGDYVLKVILKAKQGKRRCNLIVNAPPRHAKTWTFGWGVPCWYLEANPTHQVILATHTVTHAGKYTARVRNTLESRPDFFNVRVHPSSRSKRDWMTTQGGGMRAAGVGTAIQGEKCNLFIFDDLYKDRKQANSDVYAQTLIDWFSDTAFSRLESDAVMLWSTTRWRFMDIVGHLLTQSESDSESAQFYKLVFPALATKDNDILGRKKGEALCPERYSRKRLLTIKRTTSPITWGSLYQQKPRKSYGKMIREEYFSYFRCIQTEKEVYYQLLKLDGTTKSYARSNCWHFQFCDTAMLEEAHADWTAVVTVAITIDNQILVLDVERDHKASDQVWAYIYQQWTKFYPLVKRVFVEYKQSGITAFQTGQRAGLPLFKVEVDKGKEIRAMPMQELYQQGQVWHLIDGPYRKIFEPELTIFPDGAHDDMFDAMGMCCNAMQSDAMWTPKAKFPYYGVRRGLVSQSRELARNTPKAKPRSPFGIYDGTSESTLVMGI